VKISKEREKKNPPSRPIGVKPSTLNPPKVKISKEKKKTIKTIRA
jgi:hypothetical protein